MCMHMQAATEIEVNQPSNWTVEGGMRSEFVGLEIPRVTVGH